MGVLSSGFVVRMQVYYCGGIYEDETVATCAIYNPTANTWSTAMAPMTAVSYTHLTLPTILLV